jgi:hypothetical protein
VADTVGHDMNRGVANYLRPHRPVTTEGGSVAATSQDMADGRELTEDQDLLDDEAIEHFGRELAGLGEAEVTTQDLEEDEATDATASSAPSVPF